MVYYQDHGTQDIGTRVEKELLLNSVYPQGTTNSENMERNAIYFTKKSPPFMNNNDNSCNYYDNNTEALKDFTTEL